MRYGAPLGGKRPKLTNLIAIGAYMKSMDFINRAKKVEFADIARSAKPIERTPLNTFGLAINVTWLKQAVSYNSGSLVMVACCLLISLYIHHFVFVLMQIVRYVSHIPTFPVRN